MGIVALDVLEALRARLQDITTANGYRTEAGQRVFLGRLMVDQDEVPALSVLEDEDPFDVIDNGPVRREVGTYRVQGVIGADPSNPFVAGHELLADIKAALFRDERGSEHERLPGIDATVRYTGRQIFQREPGERYCVVMAMVEVGHFEQHHDPTQQ